MGRRLAGIRLSARIARRNARRAKGRTALVAVMVALPVLAAVVLDILIRSSLPTDVTFVRQQLGEHAEARVVSHCEGRVLQDVRDDDAGCVMDDGWSRPEDLSAAVVATVPGATLVPFVPETLTIEREGRSSLTVGALVGDVDRVADAFPVADGRLPGRADEVAVHSWTAQQADLAPGDTLHLADGTTRTVTGVLRESTRAGEMLGVPADDGAPPASPTAPQEWFVLGADVTWEQVLELNELGLAVTSRAVVADPPPRDAMPYHTEGWVDGTVDVQGAAVGAVAMAVGLLEAVLLIGPAFAVGARRATRDLALLAANGAERRDLRRVVLWNGVVVGGGGAVAGALVGVVGGSVLVTVLVRRGEWANLVVPWPDVLAFTALGTLLGLAAAWLPSRQAARLDVVAALAGRRADAHVPRRVPVAGIVVLAAGTVLALVGAARGMTVLAVVGALLVMIGFVTASGALVTLLGRLAGRAPLAPRLAMRDAARQRSRTAPALAAVVAAVAGAVAGGVYLATGEQHTQQLWAPVAAEGTVQVSLDLPTRADGTDATGPVDAPTTPAVLERMMTAVDGVAPLRAWAPVRMTRDVREPLSNDVYVDAEVAPEHRCPLWESETELTEAEWAAAEDDPRCAPGRATTSRTMWPLEGAPGTVVDDGSAVALTGLPGAEAAAAALAEGKVLVADPDALWSDGTVHLAVHRPPEDHDELAEPVEVVLPGHATGWDAHVWHVVLPTSASERLAELDVTTRVVGAVAQPAEPLTAEGEDAAREAAVATHAASALEVERAPDTRDEVSTYVIVGAAAFVGLWATWVAVGLALGEARADLATLAAVGAAPGTRRRVAAAQAGVLSVTGVAVGVLAGLLLGAVFVAVQDVAAQESTGVGWQMTVPWLQTGLLAIALPTVAVAVAAATTRSRLPLVRRAAA